MRKNLVFENEISSFENFESGREILRLGVLIEKWQIFYIACVLFYEKHSLLHELFEKILVASSEAQDNWEAKNFQKWPRR